ncbi:ORF30 [Ranid herpesvirus 1]|uniref:ORF30 n=1 Tax=Ranid herpesvirus 1 TaxID=85655 RepID=Q14VS8_9VIRU|nr:ORF30 [Ranid herpesvirus 1]ABG25732.1 ORF30 [Ranid herpesvirus 1]
MLRVCGLLEEDALASYYEKVLPTAGFKRLTVYGWPAPARTLPSQNPPNFLRRLAFVWRHRRTIPTLPTGKSQCTNLLTLLTEMGLASEFVLRHALGPAYLQRTHIETPSGGHLMATAALPTSMCAAQMLFVLSVLIPQEQFHHMVLAEISTLIVGQLNRSIGATSGVAGRALRGAVKHVSLDLRAEYTLASGLSGHPMVDGTLSLNPSLNRVLSGSSYDYWAPYKAACLLPGSFTLFSHGEGPRVGFLTIPAMTEDRDHLHWYDCSSGAHDQLYMALMRLMQECDRVGSCYNAACTHIGSMATTAALPVESMPSVVTVLADLIMRGSLSFKETGEISTHEDTQKDSNTAVHPRTLFPSTYAEAFNLHPLLAYALFARVVEGYSFPTSPEHSEVVEQGLYPSGTNVTTEGVESDELKLRAWKEGAVESITKSNEETGGCAPPRDTPPLACGSAVK